LEHKYKDFLWQLLELEGKVKPTLALVKNQTNGHDSYFE